MDKLLILQIDGFVQDTAFTALKPLCKYYGLGYGKLSKESLYNGRIVWTKEGKHYAISFVKAKKIIGRGRKDL